MEKQFIAAAVLVCCFSVAQAGYFSGVPLDDYRYTRDPESSVMPPDVPCNIRENNTAHNDQYYDFYPQYKEEEEEEENKICPGVCPSLKLPRCINYKCVCFEEPPPKIYIGCKGAPYGTLALNPEDPTCRSYFMCLTEERFVKLTCERNAGEFPQIFDVAANRCGMKEKVYCPLRSSDEHPTCQEYLDVAIVGGGPGGAYSAYKMRNSNKTMGLFEYSNRIGGRTYDFTLSNTKDVLLKLGAMRLIRGAQPLILKVLHDIGLGIRPFPQGEGRTNSTRQLLRGQSLPMWEVLYGSVPYFLNKEEKHNQHRLLRYYVEKLTGFNEIFANHSQLLELKLEDGRFMFEISFDEMLDLAASLDGKQFMQDKIGFMYSNNPDVSAISVLDDEMGIDDELTKTCKHDIPGCSKTYKYQGRNISSNVWEITAGHQGMTKELVQQFMLTNDEMQCISTGETATCKHTLNMNWKLDSIRTLPDGQYNLNFWPTYTSDYKTHPYVKGDVDVPSVSPRRVCAKQVILAMSVTALKEVDWEPLQSPIKDVYNAVTSVKASKIFMTFRHPWWLNTNFTDNAVNVTIRNMLVSAIYDWRKSEKSGDYILLASYADNKNSEYMRQLQDTGDCINGSATGPHKVSQALWEHVRQSLALTFGVYPSDIPRPLTSVAQFWTDYPFGHGWVSTNKGYNFDDLTEAMMQPSLEDAVYVVGSDYAWGNYHGWCEGAFETVKAVLQKFFPEDVAGVTF